MDRRTELTDCARSILQGHQSILHGACNLYWIVRDLGIDQEPQFSYLWAISSTCSELPMDEADRFNRHPDWLASQQVRLEETENAYREQVLSTCRYIVAATSDNI